MHTDFWVTQYLAKFVNAGDFALRKPLPEASNKVSHEPFPSRGCVTIDFARNYCSTAYTSRNDERENNDNNDNNNS